MCAPAAAAAARAYDARTCFVKLVNHDVDDVQRRPTTSCVQIYELIKMASILPRELVNMYSM